MEQIVKAALETNVSLFAILVIVLISAIVVTIFALGYRSGNVAGQKEGWQRGWGEGRTLRHAEVVAYGKTIGPDMALEGSTKIVDSTAIGAIEGEGASNATAYVEVPIRRDDL